MKKHSKGFTLVEVALAMLVVAIGVLAVFSLLSSGMKASARALADTHAAMFADNVFSGLRARALVAGDERKWTGFWKDEWPDYTGFLDGHTNITIAASDGNWNIAPAGANMWTNSQQLAIRAGVLYTQVFANAPSHDSTVTGLENHAFRYRITGYVTNVTGNNKVTIKKPGDWSQTITWDSVPITITTAHVTLRIWDGKFGTTNENEALVFYSAFTDHGDM